MNALFMVFGVGWSPRFLQIAAFSTSPIRSLLLVLGVANFGAALYFHSAHLPRDPSTRVPQGVAGASVKPGE